MAKTDLPVLTPKQKEFVDHLLSDPRITPTEAARRADFSFPARAGHKLTRNKRVRAHLRGRVNKLGMQADEMIERLSDMGRASICDLEGCWTEEAILDEEGETIGWARRFSFAEARRRGIGHLIKKVIPSKYGDVVELHDSKDAIKTLAGIAGLVVNRHHHKIEDATSEARLLLERIQDPELTQDQVKEIQVKLVELRRKALEDQS